MAGLRLGPLLRYVDGGSGTSATLWVEADRPCTAEARCPDGAGGSSRTFQIAGHHYALIPVTGLAPGTATPYEVLLDGRRVWPPEHSAFPPSVIRTPAPGTAPLRVAFGSCRWAAPPKGERDPAGPDALDTLATTLAARLTADPDAERPDVLLLLGDQVYADSVSRATRRWLAARRDLADPPGAQVGDYDEYTRLYDESWGDPEVRWLLSTVPSCMIFDDHDVIDDWNTSAAWLAEMRATPWWSERLVGGLMSYWVYQHLGNLPPAELAADPLYAAVRGSPDGTEALRRFAAGAGTDPAAVRWSYRRDLGRVRLLMVDSRAARVLDEQKRAMLDEAEADWVREQVLDGTGPYDHLLIGTSLPWLLPPLVHDAEGWNAALCRGERGPRWARFGEKVRRRADLEHWAAFPSSFSGLAELIARAGTGPGAPATVCVLSGDVHHAYLAEPLWPTGGPDARVLQLTCSPVHNSVPAMLRAAFRFGWSRWGRRLGRALARHGRLGAPPVRWRRTGGPWFGNQLMTLTLTGRTARLRLDQARAGRGGAARLVTVLDEDLTP
ncbi:alkaline phosphatase D family protein [Streptomyces sp. TLI_146]|uniref:alkaline phosphatase D family protein n=1 Tax=Streptomyces sp. TLI_146 TaxID=1938858 RepID=UPI000C713433|nr:alkaline phosphatase D family protein [Streptomyces sp. TLI_146]PKV85534.1 PhoD-like phosphatase [Streptomyces sp. TLI_146]